MEHNIIHLILHLSTLLLVINMCFCLIRAVRGPSFADRILATNMICVKTILLIMIVGVNLGEAFLVDVALVYALLSFLAVVVLSRFMLQLKLGKQNNIENLDQEQSRKQ